MCELDGIVLFRFVVVSFDIEFKFEFEIWNTITNYSLDCILP